MGPPPPAPLPDELVEEILLRIPPSDPVTLARATVAKKRWCRLVADPGFRRRYRDRYRAPPLLGFFCDRPREGNGFTSFVPASSFRPKPRADCRQLLPMDARHGRVLLHAYDRLGGDFAPAFRLVVWDPITHHRVELPRPKGLCDDDEWYWRAMVLCAAPAGSCDHIDCHRGHFIVVLIGGYPSGMFSCVYTSQAGAWSKIIFARNLGGHNLHGMTSSAHVGNALYCMLDRGNKILKYDLGTRELSVMGPPVLLPCEEDTGSDSIHLTTMEDGQLGLAVLPESTLYILSTDEEFGWGGTKTIDLKKCGNYVPSTTRPFLIGFAGDIGLVSLNARNNGFLSVDIRSAQVKVVDKRPCIYYVVPYINFCFCSTAMGGPSKDDQPRAGASRDVQSCVASSVLRQADDTGGQSQRPVDSHRARAVRQPQPR